MAVKFAAGRWLICGAHPASSRLGQARVLTQPSAFTCPVKGTGIRRTFIKKTPTMPTVYGKQWMLIIPRSLTWPFASTSPCPPQLCHRQMNVPGERGVSFRISGPCSVALSCQQIRAVGLYQTNRTQETHTGPGRGIATSANPRLHFPPGLQPLQRRPSHWK